MDKYTNQIIEYVDRISEKFSYDDELKHFLYSAIELLVNYYGQNYKDVIFSTFENCEIHVQEESENSSEYLSNYFEEPIEDEEGYFTGGIAFNMPIVKMGNKAVELKNIIYVRNSKLHKFDFSKDECQSTIIHEMCHAIKTYGHVKVESGIATVSSGLLKYRCQYNPKTGRFEDLDVQNVELEEAINTFDELNIMTIMKGNSFYKQSGYATMLDTVHLMMQVDDIEKIVRLSQFSGNDEWIEYLGEDTCNEIIEGFSKIYIAVGRNSGKSLRQRIRESKEAKEKLHTLFNNYINRNKESDNNYETKKEEYKKLSESRRFFQKLEYEPIEDSLHKHEQNEAGRIR